MPANLNGAADLGLRAPSVPDVKVHEENQAAYAAYREQQEANMVIEQHLAQMRMSLDAMSPMLLRFTAMLEVLCDPSTVEGEAKQIAIEHKFQTLLHDVLVEMRRQAVTAQLQAGAQVDPAMLEAIHRAQGGKPVNRNLPPGLGR
jgi:hypothetical protein